MPEASVTTVPPSALTQSTPTAYPKQGPVLAFDYGLKYTGVAIGDLGTGICRSLGTLTALTREARSTAIKRLLKEWEPVMLVVGLALDADGAEQESSRRCRNFATELASTSGLPTALVDERYTSLEADSLLREQGLRAQDRAAAEHGAAAAIILHSYLESHPL